MTRPSYRPLVPRPSNDSCADDDTDLGTSSPPGEPLVDARCPPSGKPRCPPAISRLRVEKIEGGLVVAGVVVAANCQIILPIFGFLFMFVGCVLTAASYRGCGANEQPDHYAARIAFTGNSRVLGPVCIVAGAIMTAAGVGLCLLMRAAQRRQRRLAFHCPIHGDFYPLSPLKTRKGIVHRSWWQRCRCWLGMEEPAEPPRCPRSSDTTAPPECPPPLPFLVPSDSVVGLGSALGAPLTPEQTFGSIKSLAVTREVASFPLSRSPTPPPVREPISEEDARQAEEESSATAPLECKMSELDELSTPSVIHIAKTDRPASVTIDMPHDRG